MLEKQTQWVMSAQKLLPKCVLNVTLWKEWNQVQKEGLWCK